MKALSGELDYRIRYDVEHDLFHAQNVFNDEYIKPTFIEYVQKLEKENAELEEMLESERDLPAIAYMQGAEKQKKKGTDNLTKAKKLLKDITSSYGNTEVSEAQYYLKIKKAEQFLSEVEK